jgi:hypothetical protein
VTVIADQEFPFTHEDMYQFVKSYLGKKGAQTRFKDNLPTI